MKLYISIMQVLSVFVKGYFWISLFPQSKFTYKNTGKPHNHTGLPVLKKFYDTVYS